MPQDRTVRGAPDNIELRSIQELNSQLKARCAALQQHVDDQGEEWMKGIPGSIVSYESAAVAVRQYSRAWMEKQLWSDMLKAKILRTLIASCEMYVTVDTSSWQEMLDAIVVDGIAAGDLI